ncbi:MAG: alpha/beta hydrolase [Acidobacteriota bacterium]
MAVTPEKKPHERLVLPSLAVAGSVGLLGLLRHQFQSRQIFEPQGLPEVDAPPSPFGPQAQDQWFESRDGRRLHGWWIVHPRARGTVLFCHGNSGSIGHQIALLERLRPLRMNFFLFDYRGYGQSAGTPSEKGVFLDVRAAWDHLTGPLGQPAEQIILFGHSLGGAIAIDCALDRPVAGLVVQSSFTDIRGMARVRFPRLPAWVARNQFRSRDKVQSLSVPKLFIHGMRDRTIPHQLGVELYEAATAPKQLFLVPRANHRNVALRGGRGYLRQLMRFRDQRLRATTSATAS